MSPSSSILMTVSSLITGSLTFILDVALLVVALTIVRKRRADASVLMAASAGVQLFATIASRITYALLGSFVGVSSFRELTVVVQLGFSILHAIGAVLLILGIVKLASEPSDAAPRY